LAGTRLAVAYGAGVMEFELPPGMTADLAQPRSAPSVNVAAEAEAALRRPIAGPPLRELARAGQKACIVFTDATRDVPDDVLVAALLRELHAAGLRREDVTLLCGVGMHRPSTAEEKCAKLGPKIAEAYRVVDSKASSPADLTYLGDHDGVPLWVSRIAAEADLLLATGVVEPHQYAGYSGGRKTVAVGAGGEATIAATHSPRMIERPGVRLGNTQGNPFHLALTESARRAGLRFVVNVVKDGEGRVVAVAAGEPRETLAHLVNLAAPLYQVSLAQTYDVIVAGVGHPKDANLYQASRAVTYTYLAPRPVLKPGGVIIVPAPCGEGVGLGLGEQRFAEAMRFAPTPDGVAQALRDKVTLAGEQRAYLLARVLRECRAIFVGAGDPESVCACHMTPCETMAQALSLAAEWTRREADVLVVPHALLTVLRGPEPIADVMAAVGYGQSETQAEE